MNEQFVALLTARGWLAFKNLYFDNAVSVNPLHAGNGAIAYDTVSKVFYFYRSEETTSSFKTKGNLAIVNKNDDVFEKYDFPTILITSLDHLQNYSIETFEYDSPLYTEIVEEVEVIKMSSGFLGSGRIANIPNIKTKENMTEISVKSQPSVDKNEGIVIEVYKYKDPITDKTIYFKKDTISSFDRINDYFKDYLVVNFELNKDNLL